MEAAVIATFLFWVVGLFIAYWVIRLAVRHAIVDADWKRYERRRDGRDW